METLGKILFPGPLVMTVLWGVILIFMLWKHKPDAYRWIMFAAFCFGVQLEKLLASIPKP